MKVINKKLGNYIEIFRISVIINVLEWENSHNSREKIRNRLYHGRFKKEEYSKIMEFISENMINVIV